MNKIKELPGVVAARDKQKAELTKLRTQFDKDAMAIRVRYAKIINDLKIDSYQ